MTLRRNVTVSDEVEALAGADFMVRLREVLATRTERSEEAYAALAEGPQYIGGEDITPEDDD